ncbi:SET domain-containing protein [Hypoxylon fuscum]|nr:SET domain-containing protein [Hypoxylon fuscum]
MNLINSLSMIEIRRSDSVGGEAVFATANIDRGTRLAAEIPLLVVPLVPEEEELSEVCKAIDQLPEGKQAEIAELSCNPSVAERLKKDNHIRHQVWGFYKAKKWKDKEGNSLQGKKLQKIVKRTIDLCVIYFTNNVQLGPEGKYGSGIFPLFSRMEHSCVPNAHNSWNPTLERLTIHAIHDIKADEQIFVDFIGNVNRTRQQRAASLITTWGIICNCQACTEPKIDQLRHRMLVLDQALAAFVCGASKQPNFSAVHGIPRVATSEEALEAAEELVHLLETQNLQGMELCRV